jgi:hypothetical protein
MATATTAIAQVHDPDHEQDRRRPLQQQLQWKPG